MVEQVFVGADPFFAIAALLEAMMEAERTIHMAEPSGATYALLRKDDIELDTGVLAHLLAPILECPAADLQGQLARQPGILLSELPESVASQAARVLEQAGVGVWLLPQSDVVIPPPMVEIRRGKVLPEGFQFKDAHATVLVPWEQVVYFDAVQIQTAKNVITHDREPVGGNDGVRWHDTVQQKLETGWQEFLDVVCHEPWVHLRIDKDQFRYPESGLPRHSNAMKNFLGLVIAFKTRCANATEGPGIGLLFDGRVIL